MFAPAETAEVYAKGFRLFGLWDKLETFMSDSSPASFKLEQILVGKNHTLCFQHFRQHLWDAAASFSLNDKSAFWTLAMKILKWRGYSDDDHLMSDIAELQRRFELRSDRMSTVLRHLLSNRHKLCMYHVSKTWTSMRIASSIAESTHSAIKGAGEFNRLLRASNFYESLLHIFQCMKVYVDDTVKDIQQIVRKGYSYSKFVYDFVESAWSTLSRCKSVKQQPGSQTVWIVLEDVPPLKSSPKAFATNYVLPAYTQSHLVTLSDDSHPTCSCPEYTQGRRICCAVCAVLFFLGRANAYKDVANLHPIWHIKNHPLYPLATSSQVLHKSFSDAEVDNVQQVHLVSGFMLSILMSCRMYR